MVKDQKCRKRSKIKKKGRRRKVQTEEQEILFKSAAANGDK